MNGSGSGWVYGSIILSKNSVVPGNVSCRNDSGKERRAYKMLHVEHLLTRSKVTSSALGLQTVSVLVGRPA